MKKNSMGGLLKQAQKLQNQMTEMQEELAKKTVEASAGGGMVKVVVSGKQELLSITLEKEVVDPAEVDMLQVMIRAAVNEGLSKSQEMVQSEMTKLTGGLALPGLGF